MGSLTGKGGRGGRRGGRGKRAAKEKDPAILAAITSCSRTHLSPLYDDCTAVMEAGTDMQGQMTEATMCILDSWKWAMGVVKAVNGKGKRQRGGRGRGRGRGKGKGKAMKKMIMKTLVDAHC